MFFGPNLIGQNTLKQATMPCSSIEAEYRAVVNATIELIWVQYFLIEFGISQDHPPVLWCQNIGDCWCQVDVGKYS
jgi:hypothetical protein